MNLSNSILQREFTLTTNDGLELFAKSWETLKPPAQQWCWCMGSENTADATNMWHKRSYPMVFMCWALTSAGMGARRASVGSSHLMINPWRILQWL